MVAVMVAVIAGASAYAFTASNTVPAQFAGAASSGVISGYVVSNIGYTWSNDGTNVVGVGLTLNHAANDVAVALTSGATPAAKIDWKDCGAAIALVVTCDLSAQPVANANAVHLTVAAVETGVVTIAGP
jgi:hypothetical protein